VSRWQRWKVELTGVGVAIGETASAVTSYAASEVETAESAASPPSGAPVSTPPSGVIGTTHWPLEKSQSPAAQSPFFTHAVMQLVASAHWSPPGHGAGAPPGHAAVVPSHVLPFVSVEPTQLVVVAPHAVPEGL
jgi:hypothetical protein